MPPGWFGWISKTSAPQSSLTNTKNSKIQSHTKSQAPTSIISFNYDVKRNKWHYALLVFRIKIFGTVCFEAVARGRDDVSNNRLKYLDVQGIRL